MRQKQYYTNTVEEGHEVAMAKDYMKDIVVELSKMNDRLRSIERRIADGNIVKAFHELPPPPQGTVYQNMHGLVAMNQKDFEKMEKKANASADDIR